MEGLGGAEDGWELLGEKDLDGDRVCWAVELALFGFHGVCGDKTLRVFAADCCSLNIELRVLALSSQLLFCVGDYRQGARSRMVP